MTMEDSMTTLSDAVARHTVSNSDRISAIVDGGRALLDIQAKLEHGEFSGILERVGLPRNTAYRWIRVAKTGLDADYITTEYGSVTELLKDRDATSGRLADMLLKLVMADEVCEGHKALIAEMQAELAARVAENPEMAARMSVAKEREAVISQQTRKIADLQTQIVHAQRSTAEAKREAKRRGWTPNLQLSQEHEGKGGKDEIVRSDGH